MAIGPSGSPSSSITPAQNVTNVASVVAAMAPEAKARIWAKQVEFGERSAMVWEKHTGGDSSILWSTTELSAGRGHTIVFKSGTKYGKLPLYGDQLFTATEQYEADTLNSYELKVELIRFAHGISQYVEPEMGMVGEIVSKKTILMGERWGEWRDEMIDQMFLLKTPAQNVVFAGGRSSFAGLRKGDYFGLNDMTKARYTLSRRGAPALIKRSVDSNPVLSYLFQLPTDALYGMRREMVSSGIVKDADTRGPGNHLFTGGWLDWDGQSLEERLIIDSPNSGGIGSPLTPRAKLGRAIADGVVDAGHGGPAVTNATEVWGGIHFEWTKKLYYAPMRQFPGWPFDWGVALTQHAWGSATANTPGKAPMYVIAYNTAGVNRGKWGMFRYTAIETTHGRYLTCDQYLRSSNGGQQARGVTQVGNVIWDAANNCVDFDMGTTVVFPCTENGVPFCYGFGLAAGAGMTAYGETRNQRTTETIQGIHDRTYLDNVHGLGLRRNAADEVVGVQVIIAALEYADMPINPLLAS
jgi:hypothetical protein